MAKKPENIFDVLEANELRLASNKRNTPERIVKIRTSEGINGIVTSPGGARFDVKPKPSPRQP